MSLTLHLPLIHRRPKCPPAPARVVRTGPVCGCNPEHHAVGETAEIAVTAEWILARLRSRRELAVALKARLEPCRHITGAGVSR